MLQLLRISPGITPPMLFLSCLEYLSVHNKRHLALWKPFVQVSVVNCADDFNMPLCREHSVNAFPTIKASSKILQDIMFIFSSTVIYFKYRALSRDDGLLYKGNKYELDQMELDVATFVQTDFDNQRHFLSEIFHPMLRSDLSKNVCTIFICCGYQMSSAFIICIICSSTSLTDIWQSASSFNFVGIVVQESPSAMAWALIINFHNDKNIRVILTRPQHPEVGKRLGSNALNRFLLFKRGEIEAMWISPEGSKWKDIENKVNELISTTQGIIAIPEKPIPNTSKALAQVPIGNITQYQVQLIDLKGALSYMLFKEPIQEIPRREIIDGKNLIALKQWTHTLSKYAPGTTPIRRLLYRIDEWLENIGRTLKVDDWNNKLNDIQLALGNPLPNKAEWLACMGSKPNLRGYPCGLWTLIHTISVEAYKTESNNPVFDPVKEVMEPFHNFIFRFLSCDECAKNFDHESKKYKLTQVSSREEMVLWFWRFHNRVNARLSGTLSEDPMFPKRQFPPSTLCAQCYDASGAFDDTQVLNFLRSYYGNIRQDSTSAVPEYQVSDYNNGKLMAAGSRHLNPKFMVHADKISTLEEAEGRLRKELDTNPLRNWKNIETYENLTAYKGRSQFYLVWLSVIAVVIIFVYCKYRRNRSKFWKTFYYHNDFKV
ncbi:Erv1 / Alr family protein [Dictyocaulus viviparus]|uniref:Sulfhydryl oxidase n=1 Tax=Dictyocaulus viviparus TaxID=29172 RepID=A0A0D8X6C6_DICVI|nr:Erv1 / Alr family protein [Dictyocaulus viviparus]